MIRAAFLRTLVAAALAVLLAAAAAPPAVAAPPGGDRFAFVRDYLSTHPGGAMLNDNEVSYQGGEFVVTLRGPIGTQGTADCPAGWYCFYESPNFGYPRGRLADCGRQGLFTWSWQYRVESAHYNIVHGSAAFYYYDTRLFEVGAGNRVRSDAAPYRNWANYVVRYC